MSVFPVVPRKAWKKCVEYDPTKPLTEQVQGNEEKVDNLTPSFHPDRFSYVEIHKVRYSIIPDTVVAHYDSNYKTTAWTSEENEQVHLALLTGRGVDWGLTFFDLGQLVKFFNEMHANGPLNSTHTKFLKDEQKAQEEAKKREGEEKTRKVDAIAAITGSLILVIDTNPAQGSTECVLLELQGEKKVRVMASETLKTKTHDDTTKAVIDFIARIREKTSATIFLTELQMFSGFRCKCLEQALTKHKDKTGNVVVSKNVLVFSDTIQEEGLKLEKQLLVDFSAPLFNTDGLEKLIKELGQGSAKTDVCSHIYYAAIYEHQRLLDSANRLSALFSPVGESISFKPHIEFTMPEPIFMKGNPLGLALVLAAALKATEEEDTKTKEEEKKSGPAHVVSSFSSTDVDDIISGAKTAKVSDEATETAKIEHLGSMALAAEKGSARHTEIIMALAAAIETRHQMRKSKREGEPVGTGDMFAEMVARAEAAKGEEKKKDEPAPVAKEAIQPGESFDVVFNDEHGSPAIIRSRQRKEEEAKPVVDDDDVPDIMDEEEEDQSVRNSERSARAMVANGVISAIDEVFPPNTETPDLK